MATHTVTFNGTAQDLTDFCTAEGYTGFFNAQPETQLNFFDRLTKAYVNAVVTDYRTQQARAAVTITSPTF